MAPTATLPTRTTANDTAVAAHHALAATLTPAQHAEARGWIEDCDYETDEMSDAAVLHMIAREYDGGLAAFAANTACLNTPEPITTPPVGTRVWIAADAPSAARNITATPATIVRHLPTRRRDHGHVSLLVRGLVAETDHRWQGMHLEAFTTTAHITPLTPAEAAEDLDALTVSLTRAYTLALIETAQRATESAAHPLGYATTPRRAITAYEVEQSAYAMATRLNLPTA